MINTFNQLFQYLEKEEIKFDKNEFLFQIQSHPDFPSLLSISDTLSFLKVENTAIRLSKEQLDLLPNRFVVLLLEHLSSPTLYFLEKNDALTYWINKNKKKILITRTELEQRWADIVLLIEKPNSQNALVSKKNNSVLFLTCFTLLFFVAFLYFFKVSIIDSLFFGFPMIGILFTIAALKDLFGTKSEMLNAFCNITVSTSCVTVVGSNKWKIFNFLNFSDLSMLFFTFQFVGLFVSLLSNTSAFFFQIQKTLLFYSIPVVLLSLYFQKFVEKKWCPICLVIIAVLSLELIYLIRFSSLKFVFSINSVALFSLIFLLVCLVWFPLKQLLTKYKQLKETELKANRFFRNYESFKNNLLVSNKIDFPSIPLVLGNKDSKLVITIITSPFCGHCKKMHEVVNTILEKHQKNIQIQLIIKVSIENQNEEEKLFFRSLMSIYFDKGEVFFKEALHNWFENKNLKKWLNYYKLEISNAVKIDSIYHKHNDWFIANNLTYTPALFINGYEYPKIYDRENLEFFISDLIEYNF